MCVVQVGDFDDMCPLVCNVGLVDIDGLSHQASGREECVYIRWYMVEEVLSNTGLGKGLQHNTNRVEL